MRHWSKFENFADIKYVDMQQADLHAHSAGVAPHAVGGCSASVGVHSISPQLFNTLP